MPIQVSITPRNTSLNANQELILSASVSGTSVSEVFWSVSPEIGTYSPMSDNRFSFTAPRLPAATSVKITATALADARFKAETTININPSNDNPTPSLSSSIPKSLPINSSELTLNIFGQDFVSGSVLHWNGMERQTQLISAQKLQVRLRPTDLQTAGKATISVFSPAPGGGESNPLEFTISGTNPQPVLGTVSPNELVVGTPESTLLVEGSNFVPASVVRWNGADRSTTFVTGSKLAVKIPAADLTSITTAQLNVFSPAPGGGSSVNRAFSVIATPPLPVLTSIAPNRFFLGAPAFTLVLSGRDFSRNSVVRWNGSNRPTTFRNSNQITAEIPATDLTTTARINVSVNTPAPGGGSSSTQPFFVEQFQTLALRSNDLIYDASRQRLYASVSSTDPNMANTVAIINPSTGQVVSTVYIGNDPTRLALSDDNQYLYVGLRTAPKVARVDLASLTVGQEVALGSDPSYGPLYAEDIVVLPGKPLVFAASLVRYAVSPSHGGVGIYDNGIARPVRTPDHTGSNVITRGAQADTLYGYNTESTEYGFRRMAVASNGVTISSVNGNLFNAFGVDIEYNNGRIYGTDGRIIDPEAGTGGEQTGLVSVANFTTSVIPDLALGRLFYLAQSEVRVFNSSTLAPLPTIALPVPAETFARGSLSRWGGNGLAYRSDTSVMIFSSVLVKP